MTVRSGSSFENTEVMVSCHPWASFDVSSTIWFALQVLTQALCDRIAAALPTSHDDLAACGLKEDVVSTYGQQILDAAKVRPSEAGRKFEGAQCQMRACAMQGAPASASQLSQTILTQRATGQENQSTLPAQNSTAAAGMPYIKGGKGSEGPRVEKSSALGSVAARFGKKRRT